MQRRLRFAHIFFALFLRLGETNFTTPKRGSVVVERERAAPKHTTTSLAKEAVAERILQEVFQNQRCSHYWSVDGLVKTCIHVDIAGNTLFLLDPAPNVGVYSILWAAPECLGGGLRSLLS